MDYPDRRKDPGCIYRLDRKVKFQVPSDSHSVWSWLQKPVSDFIEGQLKMNVKDYDTTGIKKGVAPGILWSEIYVWKRWPGDGSLAVRFEVCPVTHESCEVVSYYDSEFLAEIDEVAVEAGRRWRSTADSSTQGQPAPPVRFGRRAERVKYGSHGGTMDRVTEAWGLIDSQKCKKTEACRRVGIDPRTFDRYVLDVSCPEDGFDEDHFDT